MSPGSSAASGKVTIKTHMIGTLAIQRQAEIQQLPACGNLAQGWEVL